MNTELEKVFEYLSDASRLMSAGELEQAFARLAAASSLLDGISTCQSAPSALQRSAAVINLSEEKQLPSAQTALAMAG